MTLKVAAFQGPMVYQSFQKNIEKIIELLKISEVEDVDILCLPEGYLTGYYNSFDEALENSIDLSSSFFIEICQQFAFSKTTLLLGLNEQYQEDLYDTVVVIEEGVLKGKYRKAYPYQSYFKAGREFPVFEKKGIKYGIIICLDSMYLEPAKILALKGAKVIFCPMCNKTSLEYHNLNFPKLRRQKSQFITRSFENNTWLVTSDIIWLNDGKEICAGYSSIYNPEGEEVYSAIPFNEELLMHEIPLESLSTQKKKRVQGNQELVNILQNEQIKAFTTNELKKVSRIGAYGIAIENESILLVTKKSGCFLGLLDLPGGKIEFGETSEEALKREFIEEVGMELDSMHLVCNLVHNRDVINIEIPFQFHHIGQIYQVTCHSIENTFPEEKFDWYPIDSLNKDRLTPFAKEVVEKYIFQKKN